MFGSSMLAMLSLASLISGQGLPCTSDSDCTGGNLLCCGHFWRTCTTCPTLQPTPPTSMPTKAPTKAPTKTPTETPTKAPTYAPTQLPTNIPTYAPTPLPTKNPTYAPTQAPTKCTVYQDTCGLGYYCSFAAGTCQLLKLPGVACSSSPSCSSAVCGKGFCCQEAADGEQCNRVCEECTGVAGGSSCLPTKRGTDPRGECQALQGDEDGSDAEEKMMCFSRGECRRVEGTRCSEGAQCMSGFCNRGLCAADETSPCADSSCAGASCPTGCTCPDTPPFGMTCREIPQEGGGGAGVAVGLIALVLAAFCAIFLLHKRFQRKREMNAFVTYNNSKHNQEMEWGSVSKVLPSQGSTVSTGDISAHGSMFFTQSSSMLCESGSMTMPQTGNGSLKSFKAPLL